ncbi:hypothetical protein [Metasolibacillus sp. FSL K6-0083]|uniref:hypothetical protein n=1 Tax=Metasolibacillus sp. FSL K6-0083 TaxID=2921416 RepID=UPI00315AF13C
MIIYEAQISEFLDDVANEVIVDRLYDVYQEKIGRTSKSEIRSWDHSLQCMSNVLRDRDIPKDAKAAIEFKIPNTGKRVDFIIAGNDGDADHAVIVELKQWESVEKNERLDAVIVETYLGGANVKQRIHRIKHGAMQRLSRISMKKYVIDRFICSLVRTYTITLLKKMIH